MTTQEKMQLDSQLIGYIPTLRIMQILELEEK